MCLGLAHISWRLNETTYTSHLIYSANGLVWSGRGEEGVPSQSTGKWMCCLYCNPQAEIVAAVCSHPSEGGWAATLLLLRVSSTPLWPGMCFSQQLCSSSACPVHIGNGKFSISQYSGWPCRLFPSSSSGMAEALLALLYYHAMPWVQDWYSHWSMNLPLHFILLRCPSCVCVTQGMNSVALRKPLGSGGHQ